MIFNVTKGDAPMSFLQIVLPVLVGAGIGYCTNYIAIKMLFHPHKAINIGKWKLPFTPGVIPKNQGRLANAAAEAVGEKLLTKEAIIESISAGSAGDKLVSDIVDSLYEEDKSLVDLLPEKQVSEETLDEISGALASGIVKKILQLDLNETISSIGEDAVRNLIQGNIMLAMFLNEDMQKTIYEKLANAVSDYLEAKGTQALKGFVKEYICDFINKPANEIVSGDAGKEKMRAVLTDMFNSAAVRYGTVIADQIDIKGIVRRSVEEMDVDELEQLVLSVMKNELQTVINLGALIGAVIGIVNIFI